MSTIKVNRIENTATTDGGIDIDSSGRAGIGASSPTKSLEVAAGSTSSNGILVTGASSPQIRIEEATGVTASLQLDSNASYFGTASNHSQVFRTNNVERARLDSAGNLNVGTTGVNNNFRLNVKAPSGNGGIAFVPATDGATVPVIRMLNAAVSANVAEIGTVSGSHFYISTGATERMRIDSSGNIKIIFPDGNAGLKNKISFVTESPHQDETAFIAANRTAVSSAPTDLVFATGTASGASERMRIDSSGNVLVAVSNTTKTSEGFRIENGGQPNITRGTDGTFISFYHTSGSVIGSIQNNGGTGTLFNTSSDYRLKENVVNIADGVDRVKQLSPKRFNFIADNTKTVDGFLAHEVQTIVPECISGKKDEVDADGNAVMQGIDQSKLVPLLTAALQEAISKIETLETQHATLLARVTALEAA
jgi:hypothetical protein